MCRKVPPRIPIAALLFLFGIRVDVKGGIVDVGVDLSKSIAWGPGLNPAVTLPVHYFFVQLHDTTGQNVTWLPNNYLLFTARGWLDDTDYRCQVTKSVIDTGNGLYIFRYHILSECRQLELDVRDQDGNCVQGFPVVFLVDAQHKIGPMPEDSTIKSTGAIVPESCVCPARTTADWLTELKCPETFAQIDRDFEGRQQHSIEFEAVLKAAQDRWGSHRRTYSFCHYQFYDNQIYRNCYGEYVGFNMFSDGIFLSLARKYRLPDMDLLMNLGDWPLETNVEGRINELVPMLSWCGSEGSRDIIFPTYELTEATLEMMSRQDLDVHRAMSVSKWNWSDKLDQGFFRGRDSRQERLDLVLLSRSNPTEIDAGITRFFFFRDQIDLYGPPLDSISFHDFFKYRYQINVDGTVAAYRLPFLLAGDSLVLKQDSPYYEHFYAQMQPYVHFVPLKRDLSDIVAQIQWAREHSDTVQQIIKNARQFVLDYLQPAHIYCYHAIVLQKYADLFKSTHGGVRKGMQNVDQPSPNSRLCTCPSADNKSSSLYQRRKEEL